MKAGPISRISLGTVQFGMAYGLAAGYNQVTPCCVEKILKLSHHAGIEKIDTAVSYGESESVIGASQYGHLFKIITKTLPIRQSILNVQHLDQIKEAFEQGLFKMDRSNIDGLLVHDVQDLFVPGGDYLWRWMDGLKKTGIVNRIGISVYDSYIARILADRYELDIIQIPFNIFDQRILHNDFFDFCRKRSIAVHARSIFLQGVALMQPDDLPPFLSGLRPNLEGLDRSSRIINRSAFDLALAFVAQRSEIENIIVGVHNLYQLEKIITAWQHIGDVITETEVENKFFWSELNCSNYNLIDPRLWR